MQVQRIDGMFNFEFEKSAHEIITAATAKAAATRQKIEEREVRIRKVREEYKITDAALIDIMAQAREQSKRGGAIRAWANCADWPRAFPELARLGIRVEGADSPMWRAIERGIESAFSDTRDDATDKQAMRDADLRAALAKAPEMTLEERERQRESFARGNVAAGEDG